MATTERTFDWQPNWDPRNELHRFAVLDCYAGGAARANIMRTKTVWLDQGREGACSGFGAAHVLASTPKQVLGLTNRDAQGFYEEARRQDEWPGEDYEGSSVNGAMKGLRLRGLVKAWRWALTLAELRHGLSYHGEAESGSWWYDGMWYADEDGFVSVSGRRVGGHAYAIAGFRTPGLRSVRDYRIENSWGLDWGDRGGAWITEPDLQRLLDEDGELAVPVKT